MTKLTGPVRVRFAPSPTGYLHVGGARTAIYNDLLRQSLGGALVLRIEDTDRQRSDAAMTEQIVAALRWIGVAWDEGPFLQSERREAHCDAARRLLAEGVAYPCFVGPELLEEKRQEAQAKGETFRYRRTFPRPSAEEAARRVAAGEPHAVRFRMPEGDVGVDDLVRGEVVFPADSLDDFIILRTDGSPTYHLSVVVDDIESRITHVVRGEDHLSNVPKHLGLFRALGAEVPTFGHLPLILGPDGRRLSKRTGATSVEELRAQGFLPEALYNYLALLGWSPGDDREVMGREELIEAFAAERLRSSAAVFDHDKLRWLNGQTMSSLPTPVLLEHLTPFLREVLGGHAEPRRLCEVVELHRTRAVTLADLAEALTPYFRRELAYDTEACAKYREQQGLPDQLRQLAERYRGLDPFDVDATDAALRALADELGIKAGALIHPTRMALTGRRAGPPLFDVVATMGRDDAARRLRDFADFLAQS